jgi:hypothetical protein
VVELTLQRVQGAAQLFMLVLFERWLHIIKLNHDPSACCMGKVIVVTPKVSAEVTEIYGNIHMSAFSLLFKIIPTVTRSPCLHAMLA